MNLNGKEYYYIRNAQGDITGLFDDKGAQVVTYIYDAWGKQVSITGSLASTVGGENPYRYRGYRYDAETGLYYLGSRYYNPDFGRFMNADGITGITGGLLTHNMFAYCCNNPVNDKDDDGFLSRKWKLAIGIAAIAVGVAVTVATGGAAAPALIGALQMAGTSAAIGAGVGAATKGIATAVKGGSLKDVGKSMASGAFNGAVDGFMTGGIVAGASMTVGSLLKGASGIKIGQTAKPQYGNVNIGYGNPSTNGNTLLSINNNAGKSVFRLDADAQNMLHLHYGTTKAAMSVHRIGVINTIIGVSSGVKN